MRRARGPFPHIAVGPKTASAVAMLLLWPAVAACGGAREEPLGSAVVARVGEAPEVPTEPPLEVAELRLGASSRRALRLAPGRAFEVGLATEAARIEFSAGVPAARPGAPGVGFRVRAADVEHHHRVALQANGEVFIFGCDRYELHVTPPLHDCRRAQ